MTELELLIWLCLALLVFTFMPGVDPPRRVTIRGPRMNDVYTIVGGTAVFSVMLILSVFGAFAYRHAK